MSETIYKYRLQFKVDHDRDDNHFCLIELPRYAKILKLGTQHGEGPFIWCGFRIQDEKDLVWREFVLFGTGWKIPQFPEKRLNYLDTFELNDGKLVFHVFEVVPY